MLQSLLQFVVGFWVGAIGWFLLVGSWTLRKSSTRKPPPPVLTPAIPRDDDPEAPLMSEEECARYGHAWVTRDSKAQEAGFHHRFRSCPRCGAAHKLWWPAGGRDPS